LVDLAEALGYDALWYADERFFREVYVGLTLAALRTKRLTLGTLVTDPYSRHPAMTAAAIASLHELAPGRVILGLGAGGSGFQAMGIERKSPVAALREATELVRRLLAEPRVTYSGKVIRFDDGWLDFKPTGSVPIYIASTGRKILSLAGEIADGICIGSVASDIGLQVALSHIRQGASAAGRDIGLLDITVRLDLAIGVGRQAAYAVAKPMINYGLWFGYGQLDTAFLDYDPQAPEWQIPDALLRELAKRDWSLVEPTAHLVPDALVPQSALAGTLEDVVENTLRIARLGINHFTVYPLPVPGDPIGGTYASQIELFAREVKPRVEAVLGKGGGI
jgi:5,10-methylenetetrahydromethanopterin reductase